MTTECRFGRNFSLRTLLVAIALVGLFLAAIAVPIGSELRREGEMRRQMKELEGQGITAMTGLREDCYSLWLTQHVWPWAPFLLENEIQSLHVVNQKPFDIAALPDIPSVWKLGLAYGRTSCSDSKFSQPRILTIDYRMDRGPPAPEPEAHLLSHFPNVERVHIKHVPANTFLLRDLAQCTQLKRLELDDLLSFGPGIKQTTQPLPFATAALRGLKQIETLRIRQIPEPDDWSFLADMTELRTAFINPTGAFSTPGASTGLINQPIPPSEKSPLHFLAKLPKLEFIRLDGTPAYAADLALLAEHSSIEHLRLDRLPEGPTALAALRRAKSLRSLQLNMGQFEDLEALTQGLRELKQVKELTCEFDTLSLAHVAMLEQLTHLESLRIFDVQDYAAGTEGVRRLSALPLHLFASPACLPGPGQDPDCVKIQKLASHKGKLAPQPRFIKLLPD